MNENVSSLNYTIAGIPITVVMEPSLEHPYMKDFREDFSSKAQFSIVVSAKTPSNLTDNLSGKQLINSQEITVFSTDYGYIARYNCSPSAIYADYHVKENKGFIYTSNLPSNVPLYNDYDLKDMAFFAIRDLFFFFCQRLGMLPIHSSSIIYDDKSFLFSAPSGTGKTTHTNMWRELHGVDILDGDVTLLSVQDGTVYAHGLPWCGTSGSYQKKSVPLGATVFIKQSESNSISALSHADSVIHLYARSFAPTWDRELASQTVENAKSISKYSSSVFFCCTPDKSAVTAIKEYIDENILSEK